MVDIGQKVLRERTIEYRRENKTSLRIHYIQFHGTIELDAYLQKGEQRWRIHCARVKTVKQATDLLNTWMYEADALGFVCTTKFIKKQE